MYTITIIPYNQMELQEIVAIARIWVTCLYYVAPFRSSSEDLNFLFGILHCLKKSIFTLHSVIISIARNGFRKCHLKKEKFHRKKIFNSNSQSVLHKKNINRNQGIPFEGRLEIMSFHNRISRSHPSFCSDAIACVVDLQVKL